MTKSTKLGFTLIELLVVIAIIGVVVSMLLIAVQSARESARRLTCQNNLRQIGLAIQHHADAHRHFPAGGWGNEWVGDPDRGFGLAQPGGWVFNTLPYIEQGNLRNKAANIRGEARNVLMLSMLASPITTLNCPSRRSSEAFPFLSSAPPRNVSIPQLVAKSDYAINGGSNKLNGGPGPLSDRDTDVRNYQWPDLKNFTGISFVRSRTGLQEVTDGLSNTYLVGEKYVNANNPTGNGGDDQAMLSGDDADIRRWGEQSPISDNSNIATRDVFGSRHANVCFFVMCDGSVRPVTFGIDQKLHRQLSGRSDGAPVSPFD